MGHFRSRLKGIFGSAEPVPDAPPLHTQAVPEPPAAAAPPVQLAPEAESREADHLWDEAYDKVKAKDAQLVADYEKVLSSILKDQTGQATQAQGSQGKNIIEQENPKDRRMQMGKIVTQILDKNHKAQNDQVQSALKVALLFKEALDVGMKAIPAAALAWAAVCTGLGLVSAALDESSSAQEGLRHVIKQMGWYTSLASHLFSDITEPPDHQTSNLLVSLRSLILDMYQSLLEFLMRAVCRLDKPDLYRAAEGAVRWSSWAESLEKLEKVEKFTETKLHQFNQRQTNSQLAILASHQITKDRSELMGMLCVPGMDHGLADLGRRKNDLFEDAYKWILTNDTYEQFTKWGGGTGNDDSDIGNTNQVLWLRGDPGKGKTMLLVGIIKELKAALEARANVPDVAFFFCRATDLRLSNATSVLRGLLWMLIKQDERLGEHLDELRQYGPDVFGAETAFRILKDILDKIFRDPRFTPTYLVIDALDECRGDASSLGDLLEFINASSRDYPRVLKWLVSSRNEPEIPGELECHGNMSVSLEINSQSVGKAVDAFIDFKMDGLSKVWHAKYRGQDDAGHRKIEEIKQDMATSMRTKAEGTFLWVALIFKELGSRTAHDALRRVREQSSGLRSIYADMMRRILGDEYMLPKCRKVLLALVNTYRPPTLSELAVLAGLDDLDYPEEIVRLCGLLTINHDKEVVNFVHQSAKDFLTLELGDERNREWRQVLGQIFDNGEWNAHAMIVKNSLDKLGVVLKRNIYNLPSETMSVEEATTLRPQPDPLDGLGYSSSYWIDHLIAATRLSAIQQIALSDNGQVYRFLETKILYWLESLSLLGDISKGVVAISELTEIVQKMSLTGTEAADIDALAALLEDARRFVFAYKLGIQNFPLQIYSSLLLFSPSASVTKNLFQCDAPNWVSIDKGGLDEQWSRCLHVLEGHSTAVTALALSHNDNNLIASVERSAVVKIWERKSGQCIMTTAELSENGGTTALDFSHDGTSLAVKVVEMIMVLDIRTANIRKYFDFTDRVKWMRFSANDANLLILTSAPKPCLQIWTVDGDLLGIIPRGWPCALSDDTTVYLARNEENHGIIDIWDTQSRSVISRLNVGNRVRALAISRDCESIALLQHEAINIWNRKDGSLIKKLSAAPESFWPEELSFTTDGRRVIHQTYPILGERYLAVISNISDGCVVDCIDGEPLMPSQITDDGRQIIGRSRDKTTVGIWELGPNKPKTISSHSNAVFLTSLRSRGGQKYAVSSVDSDQGHSHQNKVWNLETGQVRSFISSAKPRDVKFSGPERISFMDRRGIQVLDISDRVNTGESSCIPQGHFATHCFSDDGSMIATAEETSGTRGNSWRVQIDRLAGL